MRRRQTGAMLALTTALLFIMLSLGIAFFLFTKVLGGNRELVNLADATSLAVAKQALKAPGIDLNQEEELQFGDCIDSEAYTGTNNINLQTYNKALARAYLVGCTAVEAVQFNQELPAKHHAVELFRQVQNMGHRLRDKLEDQKHFENTINEVLERNHVRLANRTSAGKTVKAEFKTGFYFGTAPDETEGEATNAGIPNYLQKSITTNRIYDFEKGQWTDKGLSDVVPMAKDPQGGDGVYLPGYRQIWVPAVTEKEISLMGVPLRNGGQPRNVSNRNFVLCDQAQNTIGAVNTDGVPNAFQITLGVQDETTGHYATASSSALADSLWHDVTFSIPRGYIIIDNYNNGKGWVTKNGSIKDQFAHYTRGHYTRELYLPDPDGRMLGIPASGTDGIGIVPDNKLPSAYEDVRHFIKARLQILNPDIKDDVLEADVDGIMTNPNIWQGAKAYIYLDNNSKPKLSFDPPPFLDAADPACVTPDLLHRVYRNDKGTAEFWTSSGYHNLLGYVKFTAHE
jgi:hypothetical protein